MTAGGGALLEPKRLSPPLAAVLSLIVPGLGQIYVGQVAKGLFFMALIFLGPVTGFLSSLVLAAYAGLEALTIARRRRDGQAVSAWGTLWDPTWRPFS